MKYERVLSKEITSGKVAYLVYLLHFKTLPSPFLIIHSYFTSELQERRMKDDTRPYAGRNGKEK